jgi:hypothetical protein
MDKKETSGAEKPERPKRLQTVSQDLEDPNRRVVDIKTLLAMEADQPKEDRFDFLKGRYMFRFPFIVSAINWGVGMGLVFGLHTYFRTRSLANSVYWFFAGGVGVGMPIFGYFMFRYTFYSSSIKR